jgi:hypothetical protein
LNLSFLSWILFLKPKWFLRLIWLLKLDGWARKDPAAGELEKYSHLADLGLRAYASAPAGVPERWAEISSAMFDGTSS